VSSISAIGTTVRAANDADIPAIAAIYADAVATGIGSWELSPPDENEMRARFREVTGAGDPYFVAVRDGAVVGFAYAGAYRTRPGYRHTVEDSVYVARTARGEGAGRALLTALLDACAATGKRQMIAVIGGSENIASIRLHAGLGFVEVGRLPAIGRKFGRWLDCVLMQCALGEGATTPPRAE
jgi:phosphinothricin acetyltransferase